MHFHLSCTTCGSPQKRPFNGRTFFCCISSAMSSQAMTQALLSRYYSTHIILREGDKLFPNFFPFCTIGISLYQKIILPYFIIPYLFTQAGSLLERSRQTDRQRKFFTPCLPKFFFPPLSARGPTRSAGTTLLLGWPNYGVDGRLNKFRNKVPFVR